MPLTVPSQEGQLLYLWLSREFFPVLEPDDSCSGAMRKFRMGTAVVVHKVQRFKVLSSYVARVLVHTVDTPHFWGWVDDENLVTPLEAGGEED